MEKTRLEKLIKRLADIDINSDLHNHLWNLSTKKEFDKLNSTKIVDTKVGKVEYYLDKFSHTLYMCKLDYTTNLFSNNLKEKDLSKYFKIEKRLK